MPWVLGGIGLLVLLTLLKIISSWRQVKRSPYFFMRQQAEKRLQAYLWATVGLLALAGGTAAFAWQTPSDNTLRMALLANAKPAEAGDDDAGGPVSVADLPVISLAEPEDFAPPSAEDRLLGDTIPVSATLSAGVGLGADGLPLNPVLPEEFDQFEPTEVITPGTKITPLVFSSEINDDYDPVSPRRIFTDGFFTIYATFDYDGMADGMEWAWIWRRDGEIVNGGNELWTYGNDGPGWIYYEPPEGFSVGTYTLELWVNGELFQQASLTIENEAANQ